MLAVWSVVACVADAGPTEKLTMRLERLLMTVLLLLLLGVSVMTDGRHDNRLATSPNLNRRKSDDTENSMNESDLIVLCTLSFPWHTVRREFISSHAKTSVTEQIGLVHIIA